MPVWFGDKKSKERIIIYGLEPRGTEKDDFTVTKKVVGENRRIYYSTPFGIHRWNYKTMIRYKPQLKYFRVFENLWGRDRFVIFSDLVKFFEITGKGKKFDDANARRNFLQNCCQSESIIRKELQLLKPTKVILLGKQASIGWDALQLSCQPLFVRHPSYGDAHKARQVLLDSGMVSHPPPAKPGA